MIDLFEVKQKILIVQELGLKASFAGLCQYESSFNPSLQSFNISISHFNTTDFRDVVHVHLFLDHISQDFYDTEQQLFTLDSVLSFLQGLLDSDFRLSDPKVNSVTQEAA